MPETAPETPEIETPEIETPEVLFERRGQAGFITLNRPKVLNALTLRMVRALAQALNARELTP